MKIRRTTGYALSAVFQLGEMDFGERLATRELAAAGGMPVRFLLQVLSQLAKNDILRSYRGVEGGFALAHPLEEISLLEVIEATEGPTRVSVPEIGGVRPQIQSQLVNLLTDVSNLSTSILRDLSLETVRSGQSESGCSSLGEGDAPTSLSSPEVDATALGWPKNAAESAEQVG